jgi:hypothetical protein
VTMTEAGPTQLDRVEALLVKLVNTLDEFLPTIRSFSAKKGSGVAAWAVRQVAAKPCNCKENANVNRST